MCRCRQCPCGGCLPRNFWLLRVLILQQYWHCRCGRRWDAGRHKAWLTWRRIPTPLLVPPMPRDIQFLMDYRDYLEETHGG